MFWPIHEYVEEWRLPFVPDSGDGAPTQIVDACGAVGRDLYCRKHGTDEHIERSQWTIALLESGDCHVGLEPGPWHAPVGLEQFRGFTFGAVHIDQSIADATVVIADAVQGELAGYYPYIQWPIQEKRLLLPVVRDGTAVWRDPRTDLIIAEIGLLTD
ncbi:hypothetical protein CH275_21420 [Rhodococcus sp. 06-235-1A]|uniref:hypothetical protein n=1 Tax=Rhodococcus sp. 06-235-1A TaxID=2022508 RepID=UPI000B9C74BE|nr:hypothetical protein [Rhodococcus sp. 06-235-1A]OZD01268.1 hypothetical protein CH275_21420 [Rhodococcus sp. 06-235-1A]